MTSGSMRKRQATLQVLCGCSTAIIPLYPRRRLLSKQGKENRVRKQPGSFGPLDHFRGHSGSVPTAPHIWSLVKEVHSVYLIWASDKSRVTNRFCPELSLTELTDLLLLESPRRPTSTVTIWTQSHTPRGHKRHRHPKPKHNRTHTMSQPRSP